MMNKYNDIIEEALAFYIKKKCKNELYEAVKYSLMNGGKRVRPALLLEFCKVCKGDINKALPFACAIEMIHTYSLIHDDLPCMDNDNMRRGKPSSHVAFGEDIALLAGDALLTLAFETMLSGDVTTKEDGTKVAKAAGILAKAAGISGMIDGQALDLKNENKTIDIDILNKIYSKKTGELIIAAAEIGCIIAGANDSTINAVKKFASAVGLSFQIIDDILDVTSTNDVLGKPIKSDISNKKSTYASILGVEKSIEIVNNLTDIAIDALDSIDGDTSALASFALLLAQRKN